MAQCHINQFFLLCQADYWSDYWSAALTHKKNNHGISLRGATRGFYRAKFGEQLKLRAFLAFYSLLFKNPTFLNSKQQKAKSKRQLLMPLVSPAFLLFSFCSLLFAFRKANRKFGFTQLTTATPLQAFAFCSLLFALCFPKGKQQIQVFLDARLLHHAKLLPFAFCSLLFASRNVSIPPF